MIYLCCTKKLLDDLRIHPVENISKKANQTLLGNWYVHIIRILRRKCLLFVNERTLCSFISFDFSRARKIGLSGLFGELLKSFLKAEEFNDKTIQYVMGEVDDISCTKATNRSVLGSINDLTHRYRFCIEEGGIFAESQLLSIVQDMNRMPQQNLGWKYSIEILSELLLRPVLFNLHR